MAAAPKLVDWLPQLGKIGVNAELANEALKGFSAATETQVTAERGLLGRFAGCQLNGVTFFAVHTLTKPPTRNLIVVDSMARRVWLPSLRGDHVAELAARFQRRSVEDHVVLHEFANLEYGLMERKSPAVRICTAHDYASTGIPIDAYKTSSESEDCSLWWQRWGEGIQGVLPSLRREAFRV